jgi:hypothetical protein
VAHPTPPPPRAPLPHAVKASRADRKLKQQLKARVAGPAGGGPADARGRTDSSAGSVSGGAGGRGAGSGAGGGGIAVGLPVGGGAAGGPALVWSSDVTKDSGKGGAPHKPLPAVRSRLNSVASEFSIAASDVGGGKHTMPVRVDPLLLVATSRRAAQEAEVRMAQRVQSSQIAALPGLGSTDTVVKADRGRHSGSSTTAPWDGDSSDAPAPPSPPLRPRSTSASGSVAGLDPLEGDRNVAMGAWLRPLRHGPTVSSSASVAGAPEVDATTAALPYLIGCLNSAFPDHDFACLQTSAFTMHPELQAVVSTINTQLIDVVIAESREPRLLSELEAVAEAVARQPRPMGWEDGIPDGEGQDDGGSLTGGAGAGAAVVSRGSSRRPSAVPSPADSPAGAVTTAVSRAHPSGDGGVGHREAGGVRAAALTAGGGDLTDRMVSAAAPPATASGPGFGGPRPAAARRPGVGAATDDASGGGAARSASAPDAALGAASGAAADARASAPSTLGGSGAAAASGVAPPPQVKRRKVSGEGHGAGDGGGGNGGDGDSAAAMPPPPPRAAPQLVGNTVSAQSGGPGAGPTRGKAAAHPVPAMPAHPPAFRDRVDSVSVLSAGGGSRRGGGSVLMAHVPDTANGFVEARLSQPGAYGRTFTDALWAILDDIVDVRTCDVWSYEPLDDDDPMLLGALWSFTYFFVSRSRKKVLFLSVIARNKLSSRAAAVMQAMSPSPTAGEEDTSSSDDTGSGNEAGSADGDVDRESHGTQEDDDAAREPTGPRGRGSRPAPDAAPPHRHPALRSGTTSGGGSSGASSGGGGGGGGGVGDKRKRTDSSGSLHRGSSAGSGSGGGWTPAADVAAAESAALAMSYAGTSALMAGPGAAMAWSFLVDNDDEAPSLSQPTEYASEVVPGAVTVAPARSSARPAVAPAPAPAPLAGAPRSTSSGGAGVAGGGKAGLARVPSHGWRVRHDAFAENAGTGGKRSAT